MFFEILQNPDTPELILKPFERFGIIGKTYGFPKT